MKRISILIEILPCPKIWVTEHIRAILPELFQHKQANTMLYKMYEFGIQNPIGARKTAVIKLNFSKDRKNVT